MILDDLVKVTTKRIAAEKAQIPLSKLQAKAEQIPVQKHSSLSKRFLQPGLHIIGEVKHSSPSKGTIVNDFPYLQIATEYQAANVDAISVLTEPDYFKGDLKYLQEISKQVRTPLLRKDFTIDPYMIYQAKSAGASLILLIVAILSERQLADYLKLAKRLGLTALVEVHDESELKRALNQEVELLGVNNRNLNDFSVDLNNSLRLRNLIPQDIPMIAESGIKTTADAKKLKDAGINGVLIGETLMRSTDKTELIKQFKVV